MCQLYCKKTANFFQNSGEEKNLKFPNFKVCIINLTVFFAKFKCRIHLKSTSSVRFQNNVVRFFLFPEGIVTDINYFDMMQILMKPNFNTDNGASVITSMQ